jgi:hypothetical protein
MRTDREKPVQKGEQSVPRSPQYSTKGSIEGIDVKLCRDTFI